MADRDIVITPLQVLLFENVVPNVEIYRGLNIDRTTVYSWRKGASYPSKENADKLIELFARHDIALDYNQIYQPSVHWMENGRDCA